MRHLVRLTFVLLALLMLYAVLGLASNNSPSEPRGLYRLTHEPLQRGRYVVLKMPLKQIAAVPGDTVRTAPEGSYVNGKLWPKSGIPAGVREHFPFGTYVLQPGQLWVLGDHPLSFDSRYFGMVPDTLVNATAEPLLITEE